MLAFCSKLLTEAFEGLTALVHIGQRFQNLNLPSGNLDLCKLVEIAFLLETAALLFTQVIGYHEP